MNDKVGHSLRLTALELTDAETLQSWRADPATRDGSLGFPVPASIEAERDWIRGFHRGGLLSDLCLAARQESTGVLVGYVQWRGIDWVGKVAEFGIVVSPEQRRKGIGRALLGLATDYAGEALCLRRMWLRVVEFNSGAISLYETSGWHSEGRLRQHAFRQGRYWDVLLMAIFLGRSASPDNGKN